MADAVRQKKRVAAYARVSTDSEEQFTSYEAQVDFYTRYIQNNPEWEFVAVYADEGGDRHKHQAPGRVQPNGQRCFERKN